MVVAGENLAVGPLDLWDAVEAFDLAVLPGTVRADREVAGSDIGERVLEVAREDVVLRVVADDLFDPDAVTGEELSGPSDEACAGGTLLFGVNLGVGQAGVIVDGCVDVVITESALVAGALCAAVGAPAASSGIRPIFLTSMWTRSPGAFAFVAQRGGLGGADQLTG